MENVNLIIYREPNRTNFGDELSVIILQELFKKYKINVNIIINTSKKYNLCFIGSLLGWSNMKYNNVHILGSGIRTEKDTIRKNTNMKIYSVRGPLTKQYIESYGYSVPNIFGDPALLLPNFYKPKIINICNGKIGVVGHLTNFKKYSNLPSNFILVNPTWNWEKVIDYIYSCNLILSSSLHGLILADAYKIPNIWLDEFPLNEGHFKFKDYFLSQNRKIENIKNINEYDKVLPYTSGNIIDLTKIENAFKKMCYDLNFFSHN